MYPVQNCPKKKMGQNVPGTKNAKYRRKKNNEKSANFGTFFMRKNSKKC